MKTSKVAIVGLGNIGQAVSGNLAKGGHPFIAADRSLEKAVQLASSWGDSAHPSDISSAVRSAQIIVLCIPFGAIAEFMVQYGEALQGKIIVDPSNPIAPDDAGGFKKIIDQNQSAGQINTKALPKGAKIAKALGTLGAGSLSSAAYQNPEKAVLFYATNDNSINADIEELILNNGFDPSPIGYIDQCRRIEVFGDLHEFGALGKTVTLQELKNI